jgi:head-tail adaptor
MGALSQRKVVTANADNLYRVGKFQQLIGTPDGQGGLVNGGTWTDVSGLIHVPFNYKTWTPWAQFHAQQIYPGVNARLAVRYRKSVPITPNMRLVYGSKIYVIRGMDNYDQANAVIFLYCEEHQATGSGH